MCPHPVHPANVVVAATFPCVQFLHGVVVVVVPSPAAAAALPVPIPVNIVPGS